MLKPIVLVEDSSQDVELTLAALTRARLANEVIILRDGEEALEFLCCRGRHELREKGNPALVLLDIKLPKVDGLEVLKYLKHDPELKSIPVVMLTSSQEEPDLAKSYELGANGYVVKPVRFQDFAKAVQDLGGFWAVLNEPPPGSVRFKRSS
jgi:CheY-like chemotaxis protein